MSADYREASASGFRGESQGKVEPTPMGLWTKRMIKNMWSDSITVTHESGLRPKESRNAR